MSGKHVEDALTHELVHVWDGRRFESRGGGEWGSDLRSHACTEVSRLVSFRCESVDDLDTDLDEMMMER
jgi:hypothetical protein